MVSETFEWRALGKKERKGTLRSPFKVASAKSFLNVLKEEQGSGSVNHGRKKDGAHSRGESYITSPRNRGENVRSA